MNVGLLGCDRQIEDVIASVQADGGRVIMASGVSADVLQRLVAGGACDPRAARQVGWESLVDSSDCDAILVGSDGWDEARGEAVRRLVQAGRRLVVAHPLELSMLWAYEIDMIRADSGAVIVPYLPDRLHPFVARIRGLVEAELAAVSPLGDIDAILLERGFAAHDRDTVLRGFCRDADLLRAVAGDPQRLSTLGATPSTTTFATLAVELSGPVNLPVRWQVVRGGKPLGKLSLLCEGGTVTIEIPDGPQEAWTFRELRSDGSPPIVESLAFDRPGVVLSALQGARTHAAETIPSATWADAARSIELAETVPRSIAKGRGIDLHQEEFSEIGTFKGTMASLGCGIVLAGLLLLMIATLIGGVAREAGWEFGERVAGAWPWIVLTVLVLFLVLQIIPLLVGETPKDRPPRG